MLGDVGALVRRVEHQRQRQGGRLAALEPKLRCVDALCLSGVPAVGFGHGDLGRVEQADDRPRWSRCAARPSPAPTQNTPSYRPPRRSSSRSTLSSNASSRRSRSATPRAACGETPGGAEPDPLVTAGLGTDSGSPALTSRGLPPDRSASTMPLPASGWQDPPLLPRVRLPGRLHSAGWRAQHRRPGSSLPCSERTRVRGQPPRPALTPRFERPRTDRPLCGPLPSGRRCR